MSLNGGLQPYLLWFPYFLYKEKITLKKLILQNQPKIGEPEFLMIITGTDIAYTTENNVLVVPIGCLKN